MQLSKHLVLFRFILRQFGYESFEDLRDEFNNKQGGNSSTGYSYFASALMTNSGKMVDDRLIQEYDEAIQGYEKKLRENRAEPFLTFKYFQWFSLLFSEYFFDQCCKNKIFFLNQLNEYLHGHNDFKEIENYKESDLKKLAYWMATGSGKTLLMHCNYWQITKYFRDWENIILITPNEGLSRQHYESLIASGIPAKIYSGSEESLKTKDEEVLILEITKLVKEKEGEGVSVDVDYFSESKNLVFIDEGHKGQKSEERAWKNLREHLTRGEDSFTFEYSATFGQIITNSTKDLLQEYGKSIIFDYSYRHFYTDGYGKDFSVFNLDEKNKYSDEQIKLLMTGSLLGYYEQLELFEQYKTELRKYNIEKPLWVFVGSKVLGPQKSKGDTSLNKKEEETVSDVSQIVKFFKYALTSPLDLQQRLDAILSNNSGLHDANGDDIFKKRFEYLKMERPGAEEILTKVFNGMGNIEAFQIKQADGEIALKTKTSDQYFAVINIGDVPKYSKKLEEDTDGELAVQDDSFTKSLFQAISETDSTINILIGSKKFIEGWNSWRVSSMGLMNMGKGEGAQIIQLFGRGVRLKGKDFSLKREESNTPYHVRALQNISIMGLNGSYVNRFLEEIEKEVPDYTEYPIKIKLNQEEKWDGHLITFKKQREVDFKDELFEMEYRPEVASRVTIDLRNQISVSTGGLHSQVAEDAGTINENFINTFKGFIDFNTLVLEANRYRLIKGYRNMVVKSPAIEQLIRVGSYKLLSNKEQFKIGDALSGKVQAVAINLVKDYMNKYYADKEKAFLTRNLTYDMLDHSAYSDLFPASNKMIVKIPRRYELYIKELEECIKVIYDRDDPTLPSIRFDNHLYSPIIVTAIGDKYKEIKTVPVRLNKDEKKFINHLREYIKESPIFKQKELYILRNLSVKGIGFFMESSSFYPDFIVWVIDGKKQYIYFLDPKGILLGDNHFNNPKTIWCRETVPELSLRIQDELETNRSDIKVSVSAYILAGTPYESVKDRWGEGKGTLKEQFKENHVLFIEDNKAYLKEVFHNLT